VIGVEGEQLGVLPLGEAINLARANQVDLVEIAPNAVPPVCRLVDYGKYRYELSKREKEAKKHQHANRVKEIQLTATIDPHDLEVKLSHAVDFLCEEMKVKASLRFRGREMAHKEFGFQTLEKFVRELAPYGQPDSPPKLAGRNLNVMLSPLPRAKRAPNPHRPDSDGNGKPDVDEASPDSSDEESA
jgi:translation initiation factor IF-3